MNDTLASNFMIDAADSVMLVDFEYASNNERASELAFWFDEMAFSPAIERELIEAYCARYDPAIEGRLDLIRGRRPRSRA